MSYLLKSGRLAFMVGLLFSCSTTEDRPLERSSQLDKYFPLSDFVMGQIPSITGKQVSKQLFINGEEEKLTLVLDEVGWIKELDLFIQSDINKTSLVSSYSTTETDEKITHRLIDGEPGDVQLVEVFKDKGEVEKVSFSFRKENTFYLSEGSGTLRIDPVTNTLRAYRVTGRQKVWFLPANAMEVTAEIMD